jgi:hypothetical protein
VQYRNRLAVFLLSLAKKLLWRTLFAGAAAAGRLDR